MTGERLPSRPDGDRGQALWTPLFLAWLIALVAVAGALFLGEVMGMTPCVLCWYQRIAMFPLAILLPLGLFPFDARVVRYTLPLAVLGWGIAAFQVLLVAGVIPEGLKPCTQGVPCAEVQVEWLGFLNIPVLSLIAFTTLIALLVAAHLRSRR